MAEFNRNNRFSRGRDNGGFKRRGFNDRFSRGPMEMHKAVCANCGKACEVPFRPTSGRPIYCQDCFKKEHTENRTSPAPRNFEQPTYPNYKDQLQELNGKLDKILALLSSSSATPAVVKPVTVEEPTIEKKKKALTNTQ